MEPLISVIVAIYNVESYLEQCIESILYQTYTNLEIILVNDGSQDGSGIICEKYAALDARIKVVHKQNEGVSAARNTGLMMSNGNYIGFVDGDDYIKPDMYRNAIEVMCRHESDVVFWGYSRAFENDVKEFISLPPLIFDVMGTVSIEKAMLLAQESYFTSVWNKLYRREVCKTGVGNAWITFNTGINLGEDEVWLFEVLEKCKSVYVDNKEMYVYRQRNESLTRNLTLKKQIEQVEVGELVNRTARKIGKNIDNLTAAVTYIRCYKVLVEAYKNKDKDLIKTLREKCRIYQRRQMNAQQYSLLGKLKRGINIALMDMHFPVGIIDCINRMGHS